MSFSLDPAKKAQEVIFSREITKKIHLKISFINIPVSEADSKTSGSYNMEMLFLIKLLITPFNRD